MKKKHKALSLLLALAMMITYMPAMAFAESEATEDDEGGNVPAVAELQETGGAEITGNEDVKETTSLFTKEVDDENEGDGIDDTGDQSDPDVSVNLKVTEGEILINDWFEYSAEASGKGADQVDYIVVYADYKEGSTDWGMSRSQWGTSITSDDQRMWYEEPGTYIFAAAAWHAGEGEEDDEMLDIATQEVTVTPSGGSIGEFSITGLKVNGTPTPFDNTVTINRGDKLDITCSKADNAGHYWVDALTPEGDDDWEYYGHFSDIGGPEIGDSPTLHLNTIELAGGIYKLNASANNAGYSNTSSSNFIILEVNNKEVAPGEMYFAVDKGTDAAHPLDTCEELEYEVYCPGAYSVVVYPGWPGQWWRNEMDDTDSLSGFASYDESGRYTLRAVAYVYDEQSDEEREISSEINVYVSASTGNSLTIAMPGTVPSHFVVGEDPFEFDVAVPKADEENWAEGVSAIVRVDREDEEGFELFQGEVYKDEEKPLTVSFDKGRLEAGDIVTIELDTWAPGYEAARAMARIPVVSSEPSDDSVHLEVDDKNFDKGKLPVNADAKVTVTKTDTADDTGGIERVRFFGGYDFWDEEEIQEGEVFEADVNFGEVGTFSLFAEVKFAGSEDWITTNVVAVTTTSNGRVGEFDIDSFKVNNGEPEDLSGNSEDNPLEVTRGDNIAIKCRSSEGADHYWAEADRFREEEDPDDSWWEDNWDDFGHTEDEDRIVAFNTIDFGQGLYRIRTQANAVGLETEEAETEIYIEVKDPDVPEGEMIFDVSKGKTEDDALVTCEEFTFTAYCPGADWIEIFWDADNDDDDDPWCDDNDGGNTWYDTFSYDKPGTYKLRAVAYKNTEGSEPEVKASEEITVFVTASQGEYALAMKGLPSYIIENDKEKEMIPLTVTVPVDENGAKAEGVHVNAWWSYEGDDEEIRSRVEADNFDDDLYNGEFDVSKLERETIDCTFNTKDVPADSRICVRVEAWGYDHEKTVNKTWFPVISATSEDVEIEASCTETPVNKDVKFTVSAGSEIEKVRFFNGNDLEDEEGPDVRDNKKYYKEHSFGEAGQYAVYAKVKLAGNEGWLTTKPIAIEATSEGSVGDFAVTGIRVDGTKQESLTDIEVKRGGIVTIEHESSEHADHYWIDVNEYVQNEKEGWYWDWYDHMADTNRDDVLTLGTAGIEPGEYRLYVRADAENYESAEAGIITLTVTEPAVEGNELIFNVPGAETTGDKTTLSLQVGEEFTFSAYCKDAYYIRVYRDYQDEGDNDWCSDNIDYDWDEGNYKANPGYSDTDSYNSVGEDGAFTGKYVLKAVAYGEPSGVPGEDSFADGDVIGVPKEIEVTVTAAGSLEIDETELPDGDVVCSGGLTFTVSKPEHATGVQVKAYYKNDPGNWDDDEEIYREVGFGDKLNVVIPGWEPEEEKKITVRIYAWGLGYNEAVTEKDYTVAEHKDFETTYEWAEDNSSVTATRVCTNSSSHFETETAAATSERVEATCTQQGNIKYTAVFENTAFKEQEKTIVIDAKGHVRGAVKIENKVAESCTAAGSYDEVVYCTVCQAEISRTKKTTAALGHSWNSAIVVGPTEETEGVTAHTCSRCGETYNTSIARIVLPTDLPKVAISKPAAGKKKATVKWKKVNSKNLKKIGGIEIQVATDAGFTNIVKRATAGKKKTSKVIKGLSPNTKYWVRIRAYKNAPDGKHVSVWKTKTVKIKK